MVLLKTNKMEKPDAAEFLDRLNAGTLKTGVILFGKAKKSDKKGEMLFAFKWDMSNWIRIPAALIKHVHALKTFEMEGEKIAVVKIHLEEPSNGEAKVFYDLLAPLSEKLKMIWIKKMMMMGKGMQDG